MKFWNWFIKKSDWKYLYLGITIILIFSILKNLYLGVLWTFVVGAVSTIGVIKHWKRFNNLNNKK